MSAPLNRSGATPGSRRMVLILFALLFALHHDFWWWADRRLVFGFLPVGLFYHALFSLAAGGLWALASRCAWPDELERWANEPAAPEPAAGDGETARNSPRG